VPYLEWDTGIFYPKLYDKFGRFSFGTPSPTTDMNQAMECWEKEFGDYDTSIQNTGFGWYVFINYKCGELVGMAHDPSAPLAICKAILKAKGIEIE